MAQRKPKRNDTSCNPFKFRKDEKDTEEKHAVPLVDFEPETKDAETFVYDDRDTSEMATSVSPHTLKLFEAIREDEMELVEEELDNLTDMQEIDRTGKHGFALIHVAARYNFSRIVKILLEHGADINIGTKEYHLTPLHLAARFNGLSTVNTLLERGADPSVKGRKGDTALHFAARRGNEEIVKILLQHSKVNVNDKDVSGKTALHLACNEGHSKVCQLLLNYGADVKAVSADKTTPLHSAILNGHSQVAIMILNRASDRDVDTNERELVGNEDLQSNTVLHMAAWNNDVKTAELCLDHGADVNSKKCNETTALHLTATKGNLEMAELLISRGAGVNMKDGDSKTPLHRTALFNQTKLITFLVENGAKVNARDDEGRSPFLNAVAAGHTDSARVLLQLGAEATATDLLLKTSVHLAVENEHLTMLTMLLESRSGTNNLTKADIWDRVPLHYAAKSKDIKILELVLSKQKHLSFRDENQKTPLHLAAESSSSKHVEALVRRISGVNERDELGRTPLHCAAAKGQRKACVALINMGAEVDCLDNLHQTPLMWSVKKNQVKCVEVLLDYKASVDQQDTDGDSALHVACGKDHPAIVSLLLDHGASLTLINGRGHDCLEVAAKAGASDVAMAIVKHKRWTELENHQTTCGQTAVSILVGNFPQAAEVVLNQCVHHSQHLNISDPDYAVTYNFKYLDLGPDVADCSKRFSTVETMIKHKRERLLLHPLTLKFNERKWTSFGRYVYIVDFFTYLLLMILFTVFIVDQREDQDFKPPRTNMSKGVKDVFKPKPSDVYRVDTSFTEAVPIIVVIFASFHFCKEIFQIYVQRWNYFKDTSNYLDWILHISMTLFMVPYVTPRSVVDEWFSAMKDPRTIWNLGILAIFVCYTNMMLFLRRYRLLGTYISMYIEVTKTVVQVMVVFVFLVLGFALVFYLLLKEQTGFHTVHHSILRVLVMMIGELDFGASFVDSIDERHPRNDNPLNPFPNVAFFFIFLCLFLLTVALMNLLVGLAVGDTEAMKKFATVKRLAMQIEYQIEIEEAFPRFLTRAVYETVYVEKPNKLSKYYRLMEWLQERFSEVTPEPIADESKPSELAKLEEEVMKNRKKMKSMMAMMDAQNKLLRSLALRIDPGFELPEATEEASWRTDGTDGASSRDRTAVDGTDGASSRDRTAVDGEREGEVPTDQTSVDLTREEKP